MSMENSMLKRELIFITLAWNREDVLLRHSIDWINESRKHFQSVSVYATHVRPEVSSEASASIGIYEIGGGSAAKRLKGAVKLFFLAVRLSVKNERYAVFYHMNVLPVLIMGSFLKIAGVPQGLWYSHKVSGLKLKIAEKLVNHCFSTSIETFPLKSKKVKGIGHGLDQYWKPQKIHSRDRNSLLVVGRISRVKKIKEIVLANSRVLENRPNICLIGQIQEKAYFEEILTLAKVLGVVVEYAGELKRDELRSELQEGSIIYSGTRGSVDKAVLEGGVAGCFIVSQNSTVMIASGQKEIIEKEFEVNLSKLSLQSQIEFFLKIQERVDIRNQISQLCSEKNSLSNLMSIIGFYLNKWE
jgi:glycosyltransferase involved in cell wall biosynthesis